jgi:quercetin dioxygenase-like cupin family protein
LYTRLHFILLFPQLIKAIVLPDIVKDQFCQAIIIDSKNRFMAYTNKTIHNPANKQTIRFLQTAKDTGGRLLEMESTYEPYSVEPPQHYHPFQSEDFTVTEGELTIKLKDKMLVLKKGEAIHIPANISHTMWNNTGKKTVISWKVYPALQTEYLLETACGLAADGKLNKNGMSFLQRAMMAKKFADMFRLAKPSFIIQRILFFLLSPVARLLNYKAEYAKYID